MSHEAFEIDVLLDDAIFARTLVDNGCLTYSLIKKSFAYTNNLTRHAITPVPLRGYDGVAGQMTNEIAVASIDVGGHRRTTACFYVVPNLNYDMILGIQWLRKEGAIVDAKNDTLRFTDGTQVNNTNMKEAAMRTNEIFEISAAALTTLRHRQKKRPNLELEIFAASMADIDKALKPKTKTDPQTKLPSYLRDYKDVFDPIEADKLPKHRPGVDHSIELVEQDKKGRKPEVP